MATNPTTKKPAAAAAAEESTESVTETAPARPARKPAETSEAVVGPAPVAGADPVRVKLSHHLTIDGTNYRPGAHILVSPDYARRLRRQGYATQV